MSFGRMPVSTSFMRKRLAKCCFCKKNLFYEGNPRHLPEVTIRVDSKEHGVKDEFFAHLNCWKNNHFFEKDI